MEQPERFITKGAPTFSVTREPHRIAVNKRVEGQGVSHAIAERGVALPLYASLFPGGGIAIDTELFERERHASEMSAIREGIEVVEDDIRQGAGSRELLPELVALYREANRGRQFGAGFLHQRVSGEITTGSTSGRGFNRVTREYQG